MHERQLIILACLAVLLGFGGLISLVLTQNPLLLTNTSVLPQDTLIEFPVTLSSQTSSASGVSLQYTRVVSEQAFFDHALPSSWIGQEVIIRGRKNGDYFSVESVHLLSEVEE